MRVFLDMRILDLLIFSRESGVRQRLKGLLPRTYMQDCMADSSSLRTRIMCMRNLFVKCTTLRRPRTASFQETSRYIRGRLNSTYSCRSEIVSLVGGAYLDSSSTFSLDLNLPPETNSYATRDTLETSMLLVQREQQENAQCANTELLASCCGLRPFRSCIHKQILTAILAPNEAALLPPTQSNLGQISMYDEVDSYGNNSLFFAARNAAPLPVLLPLINYIININALNDNGETFLHVLDTQGLVKHSSGFLTLVEALENRGFMFDHLDHNGRSFLFLLSLQASFQLSWISNLFDRCPEQAAPWYRTLPKLLQQRDSCRVSISQYISENYALESIPPRVRACLVGQDSATHWEQHPLHTQIGKTLEAFDPTTSDPEVCELPLFYLGLPYATQPNINSFDHNGHTPLIHFLYMVSTAICSYPESFVISHIHGLISLGANINARSRNGNTALHFACMRPMLKVIKYLIDKGANISSVNNEKAQPLFLALNHLFLASDSDSDIIAFPPFDLMTILLDREGQTDRATTLARDVSRNRSFLRGQL